MQFGGVLWLYEVYVHRGLLPGGKHRETGAAALRQLKYGLAKVRQMVADGPLEKLQAVKIWLEVDSTNGQHGRTSAYQYHPDLDWLEEMDFHPKKQKCVEVGNAAGLAKRSNFKTVQVAMHELAHAYHDQILTFDDPNVLATHKRAREEIVDRDPIFAKELEQYWGKPESLFDAPLDDLKQNSQPTRRQQ